MKHSNISVGLDIGTTKIVAMVGDKNEFGKVENRLGLENPKAWSSQRGGQQHHPNHSIHSAGCRGSQSGFR